MSNDGPELGIDNPIAGIAEPKSNKKKWILGGLGCLGVIGLVCVGISVFTYIYAIKPHQEFQAENMVFIESSEVIADRLGSPVKAEPMVPEVGEGNQMIFRGKVSGPKGEGVYVIRTVPNQILPERESVYLEIDGEEIDLDPEAMFNLDVDDGSN